MTTPENLQIRNVIATPRGRANFGWVCQPAEYGTPDRICGVCKKFRLDDCHFESEVLTVGVARGMRFDLVKSHCYPKSGRTAALTTPKPLKAS